MLSSSSGPKIQEIKKGYKLIDIWLLYAVFVSISVTVISYILFPVFTLAALKILGIGFLVFWIIFIVVTFFPFVLVLLLLI